MTVPESHYEMDHVRDIYDDFTSSETLRNRYLKSWERWLAWNQEHGLTPGVARKADVDRFIDQLPSYSQAYIKRDIATTYFKLGGANPARSLRPITDDGRERHQRYWSRWAAWCDRASVPPLPADPERLAAYLEEVSQKQSRRQAERALSVISRRHSESDLPDPSRTPPVIQVVANIKALSYQTDKKRPRSSSRSPNTIRRDQGIWQRWSKWCAQQGVDPMTATPEDVVAFLAQRRRKPCTHGYIKLLYHSLRTTYRDYALGHNPVDTEAVRAALHTLKQVPPPQAGEDSPESVGDAGFPSDDELQGLAPRTRKTYRAYWMTWAEWCVRKEVAPLDASPEEISAFLAEEANRISVKSVEMYVAAIACVYDATYPDSANPVRTMLVTRTMRGLKRRYGRPPAQMTGLSAEDFARIEATARRPQPWETERQALVRGTTDLAITGVMRDGLLRVSEAADLTWDDLEEMEDGTGRLTIRRSKTDQTGEGAVAFVSRQIMGYLNEMRDLVMESQTIFGVSPGTMYIRIIDAAERAGIQGRYGGHSARIGMAQDLARSNFTLLMIMQAGRWTSPQMPAHYIRKLQAGRNAVANWYQQHPGRANIE